MRHVPWHKFYGDPEADGEIPEDVDRGGASSSAASGVMDKVAIVSTKEAKPRGSYVTLKNVLDHGPTRGCGGCSSLGMGSARQPHNEACRQRFMQLLKTEAKVKNAERRKRDAVEKAEEVEAQDKKKLKQTEAHAGGIDDHIKTEFQRKGDDIEKMEQERPVSEQEKEKKGLKRDREGEDEEEQKKQQRIRWWGQGGEDEDGDVILSQVELSQQVEEIKQKMGGEDSLRWVAEIAKEMDETEAEGVDAMLESEDESLEAWDDVHGGFIEVADLRTARREEIGFMQRRGIWTEVPEAECRQRTGKAPVSVRRVDVNKGSAENPEIRCRLAARDFKGQYEKDREDLFAATPPLEAKRALISRAATRRRSGTCRKLLFIDARKAHLNPSCTEDVYIELPEEVGAVKGICGKLNFWLYGFRPAASAWERHYSSLLEGVGFRRGKSSPVIFYQPQRSVSCVVHGDDFTLEGEEDDLNWIQKLMKSWFDIKVRARLGPEEKDDKSVSILGRMVQWCSWGISYEADTKHRQLIAEYLGFDAESKRLTTNGVKDKDKDEEDMELAIEEKKSFRAVAARMNFLASDCLDIQFPSKEICSSMSNPTEKSFQKLTNKL